MHSLEIYLFHGLALNVLKVDMTWSFSDVRGTAMVLVNYILSIFLCTLIINIIEKNKYLKIVLFGNKK